MDFDKILASLTVERVNRPGTYGTLTASRCQPIVGNIFGEDHLRANPYPS